MSTLYLELLSLVVCAGRHVSRVTCLTVTPQPCQPPVSLLHTEQSWSAVLFSNINLLHSISAPSSPQPHPPASPALVPLTTDVWGVSRFEFRLPATENYFSNIQKRMLMLIEEYVSQDGLKIDMVFRNYALLCLIDLNRFINQVDWSVYYSWNLNNPTKFVDAWMLLGHDTGAYFSHCQSSCHCPIAIVTIGFVNFDIDIPTHY